MTNHQTPDGTRPVRIAVVGAGNRGLGYARWCAAHPERADVVAVCDPDPDARARVAQLFGLDEGHQFDDWTAMLAGGEPVADAVIVATQDRHHVDPAIAALRSGHHVLLEKPMATTPEACVAIVEAAERSGRMLGVCHPLRHTAYTRALTELVRSGRIGRVVGVQHLENVGWWHHAHSYVRGNWRSEGESAPMLLAKSCHDLDWMSHVVAAPIRRVSSIGGLHHFRPEQRPAEATDRCLDCPLQDTCPYSAVRIYLGAAAEGRYGWPVQVLTHEQSVAGVRRALEEGPYGECVYLGRNDVVDHQVVMMEFEGGAQASFTMSAFTPMRDRQTRIFGTHGCIEGDGDAIRLHDFATGATEERTGLRPTGAHAGAGHGGGDAGLMEAFVDAVATDDPSRMATTARDALASHLAAFAAERARHTGLPQDVGVGR